MSEEIELFNSIFEERFFIECNSKIVNNNWENVFKNLFLNNMNYYKDLFNKNQFDNILKAIKNYYNNINQIRDENQLLYDFLKTIPDIKFILKTRIKSLNSIFEKILRKKDNTDIYDIDALTIILTEYKGEDILNLSDESQLDIYTDVMSKVDSFFSHINFYSACYGNNYVKSPKLGNILNMNVKEQYLFDLDSNEIPRYFSFHKCYENIEIDRIKEIHVNTFETEKAIRGNTSLNHYIYKPCKIDDFLIFLAPNHLDIYNDCVFDYNLVECFEYNFYYKISFDEYLTKLNRLGQSI